MSTWNSRRTTPMAFAIPVDWLEALNAISQTTGYNKSEIIRTALGEYLDKPEYNTLKMDRIAMRVDSIENNEGVVQSIEADERVTPLTTSVPVSWLNKIDIIAFKAKKTRSAVTRALIGKSLNKPNEAHHDQAHT